jgi:hypothetical protein
MVPLRINRVILAGVRPFPIYPDERISSEQSGWSASCRFCCKSRLRPAANRDSVMLTRISARSIHDGPSEE